MLGAGFSPSDNRKVPPLRPAVVHALAEAFPHLSISLNGGIASLDDAAAALGHGALSGVMVGNPPICSVTLARW